jgi:peptidoglycan/xylan/chitin deacetylase (PgdA/CDA1 family)
MIRPKPPARRWAKFIRLVLFGCVAAVSVFVLSDINYAKSGRPDQKTQSEIIPSLPTPLPTSRSAVSISNPQAQPTPRVIKAQSKVKAHILMYHYINNTADQANDPIGFNLTIAPSMLDQQITALEKLGYHSITVSDAIAGKGSNRSVALTFDDGYEDFYTNAFPILKQHNWTATVYIISGRIGDNYMTEQQIRELHNYGIEVGAHTIHHIDLSKASQSIQKFEIERSKRVIEAIIDAPVKTFAYPSGKYTLDTIYLVEQAGLTSAVTTHPGIAGPLDDVYQLPRIRISPAITLEHFRELMK